jgi:vacuolar-type H+-ATPase subunit I/STV1
MENGNAEKRNQEQIAALHEANRRASEKNQRERVAALKRAKVLRSIGWALIVLALGAATSHGTASLDPGSGEDQLVIFTYFGMIITGCMLLARAKGSSILKVWVGFILLFCELLLSRISPVLAFILLLFFGLCAPFVIKYLREKRQREAEAEAAGSKRR